MNALPTGSNPWAGALEPRHSGQVPLGIISLQDPSSAPLLLAHYPSKGQKAVHELEEGEPDSQHGAMGGL